MGLLDLPSPVFDYLDHTLFGFLPAMVRIVIWAAIAALLSLELYRVLSPQAKVSGLKSELAEAQKRLNAFDGEFEDAWPLIGRMLSLAFQRIFIILPATLLASLPVLTMVVWMDSAYGHRFPAVGQAVTVVAPEPYQGKWVDPGNGATPHAEVLDKAGNVVIDAPLEAAIPVVSKWRWWNLLLGNPAGYLKAGAPVDQVTIDLPDQELFASGPSWLRGWEPAFFLAVLLFAMTLKWVRQID